MYLHIPEGSLSLNSNRALTTLGDAARHGTIGSSSSSLSSPRGSSGFAATGREGGRERGKAGGRVGGRNHNCKEKSLCALYAQSAFNPLCPKLCGV